jgi:hypothetical protein
VARKRRPPTLEGKAESPPEKTPESRYPVPLLPADASVPGVPIADPVDELVSALDGRSFELLNTYQHMMLTGQAVTGDAILATFGRQRLYNAVQHFMNQLLDHWGRLEQLQHKHGRRPGADTPFAPPLNQAMINLGYSEKDRLALWGELERLRAKVSDTKPTVNKRVHRMMKKDRISN